jgi:hypothetical protein
MNRHALIGIPTGLATVLTITTPARTLAAVDPAFVKSLRASLAARG